MTTTAIPTTTQFDQAVRLKVPWTVYESLVESLGDSSHVRLTYGGEILEILSPGSLHGFLANLVSEMLSILGWEWRISLTNVGSTRFQTGFQTDRNGTEADKSYYINAKGRLRDVRNIDLAIDPPPDLLVEIDISSSSQNKLPIYAALGVGEVWRYSPAGFEGFTLVDGAYVPIEISRAIWGLPLGTMGAWLESPQATAAAEGDTFAFTVPWREWVIANRQLHGNHDT